VRHERRVTCARNHSFDIARSGYINLLQPQDCRSKTPGDTLEAVVARRRLHDRGVSASLLREIEAFLNIGASDIVLDAGCGEGFYPGSLARSRGCEVHGIDISVPAIELAARRYPQCQWIVANADRFIPYADASFSLVVSITGRMNPAGFRRVLRGDGRLLVAVPAADDLIELRGAGKDRVERTLEMFAGDFELTRRGQAATVADLDEAAVRDVLASIYRPLRTQPVEAMRLTFRMDLLEMRPLTQANPLESGEAECDTRGDTGAR
jgi:23S rRNA (guanine745-N1)-methyltransferase